MLKIAVIADIHHGHDKEARIGSAAIKLFRKFLNWVEKTKPDLIVDLGDRISGISHSKDRKFMRKICEEFERLKSRYECHHLLGNHDATHLSISENEVLLKYSFRTKLVVKNGVSLVFWNGNVRPSKKGFTMSEQKIDELKNILKTAHYPAILFSHIPLDNGSMKGNYYSEKRYSQYAFYSDEAAKKIRKIIQNSKKVLLCINGHAHWNAAQCIDGIHYVTILSLVDNFISHPRPSESWALIKCTRKIKIEVIGHFPAQYNPSVGVP